MPINVHIEFTVGPHGPGMYVFLLQVSPLLPVLLHVDALSQVARKSSNFGSTCSSPRQMLGALPQGNGKKNLISAQEIESLS